MYNIFRTELIKKLILQFEIDSFLNKRLRSNLYQLLTCYVNTC